MKDKGITYYKNGKIAAILYFVNDQLHRIDGPAWVWYDENGIMFKEEYWLYSNRYEDILTWSVLVGSIEV